MSKNVNKRNSERGGAGVKFLSVVVVLILIANAGYNFIPVAYNAENFKQDMYTAVVQAFAMPGKSPIDQTKQRIYSAAHNNNLPPDISVEVKQTNNILTAHVAFTKQIQIIPFGIYNYEYQFDHTATPTGFLTKE
jgi:hypothetical protein